MSTPHVIREIDVRRQHRMSLRETWTLCIRGVKHRLFRSALTLAVVVLAVAFFMFLLCDSMYQRAVGKGVDAEIASSRAAQIQLTRLLTPATATSAMRHLAAAGNPPETRWIPGAPEADTEAWRASVAALGFSFSPEDLATMRTQLRDANDEADLSDRLADAAFRDAWKVKFREATDSTAEEKMGRLGDKRARELLADAFPGTRLDELAANHAAKNRLSKLERALAASLGDDSALLGLSGRQLFLLAISFLVCMVGIANAMLMSITERYREIATMKCLGATDSYILSQFMMEAALQGFFGGLIGVVLGFAISTVRSALAFGGHLWASFPAGDIALCALFSLAAGVLLAALASIQPSWAASRMAPMEAMRVE